MIELDHVSRLYTMGEEPLRALNDVSEVIEAGEYVAVMGPSGSGKSTMLNILGCLDRPNEGVYRLDGDDVGALSEDEVSAIRRHKIGFVFQSFQLLANMTAHENVLLPLELIEATDARARADELLALVGLEERRTHYPAQLSGGEQQRVALARAFATRPPILLADEPTGNLDRATGKRVLEVLGDLRRRFGTTLVLVTHDTAVAGLAGRSLLLEDGQLVPADRGGLSDSVR